MSKSSQSVSIRLAVEVPMGVDALVRSSDPKPRNRYGITSSSPDSDTPISVKPNPATPNVGSICANVEFSGQVYNVQAAVQPTTSAISGSPAAGAVAGTSTDSSGAVWQWTSANALTGVAHQASPGSANKFLVWWKKNSGDMDYEVQALTFYGVTGTNTTCGAPVTSGVGTPSPTLVYKGTTFPAFWCLEIAGMYGADAVFNHLHALRADRGARLPTWENRGDGEHSPRLELVWNPDEYTWTLTVKMGRAGFQTTAHSHSPFGPLQFIWGEAKAGQVHGDIPRILAHPV
jgi:hypothetical protein